MPNHAWRLSCPRQPYLVLTTDQYYKLTVKQYGISHFFSFQTGGSFEKNQVILIPDASITLYFFCGDIYHNSFFYGTKTEARIFQIPKFIHVFGVRFEPGFNPALEKEMRYAQFYDYAVPFETVYEGMNPAMEILHSTDFLHQIALFLTWYAEIYEEKCSDNAKNVPLAHMKRSIIESGGSAKMLNIAKESGHTVRYLREMFFRETGISPKKYARIIRLQETMESLHLGTHKDYANDAMVLGYSDQSHMIREFREFIHLTPQKYVEMLQREQYNKRLVELRSNESREHHSLYTR